MSAVYIHQVTRDLVAMLVVLGHNRDAEGTHRLDIRYDRYAGYFCAFLTLAATLTCFKKITC